MIVEFAGDAGEFQRALDHAERRVAVAVHDAIRKRAVICADAHRASVLLAKFHQRREAFANAAQLGFIFGVGVFLDREFFRVGVVAGVDADFLDPLRRLHRGVGFEMNVGDERDVAAALAQSGDDVLEIRCVFNGWRGDADDFTADGEEVECLLDGRGGVHRVARDHALHAHGIFAADGDSSSADDPRFPPPVAVGRRAVFHRATWPGSRPGLCRRMGICPTFVRRKRPANRRKSRRS